DALAAGFAGLRVASEMTWVLPPEAGSDRVIEYEALLDEFLRTRRALAVCQYHRARFSPEVTQDVLRAHPVAIIGEQICANVYYEPPHMGLGRGSPAETVDWMIGQLQRTRMLEQSLERELAERQRAEEALRCSSRAAPWVFWEARVDERGSH